MMLQDFTGINLRDIISQEELPLDTVFDPQYQSNMYLIEEALRDTGADKARNAYARSPYDAELMRLIDAVPLR